MTPNRRFIVSLIGTNPLPAFITILKNCHENTKLYLVHTEYSRNNIGSRIVAENLKRVLEKKLPGIDIDLVECDKSDTRKIIGCINNLFNCIEESMGGSRGELILDYTSGTKAMSAIFAEKVLYANVENLNKYVSYVDDNQNIIMEDTNLVGESKAVQIRDVVRNLDISIEDVAEIHGYRLKKSMRECMDENNIRYIDGADSIVFVNNNGNSITADEVYLIDCKLAVCFKSKYLGKNEGIGRLKMELFEFKDKAEKLGGNRSIILYQSDCSDEEKKLLSRYLKRDYEFEMEKRLYFVDKYESFRDRVKNVYLIEGGN